jgi:hypothetical protein
MFKSCVFPAIPESEIGRGMGRTVCPQGLFVTDFFGKLELLIGFLFLVKVAV